MDQQQSTGFQQENKLLTMIVDILLELFSDPYGDFRVKEELEIQDGGHMGMKVVSNLGGPWLDKLSEMLKLLPHDATPTPGKFPNENFQRQEIFYRIYAKLHQTLVIDKYRLKPGVEADKQEQYRKFLNVTKQFLNEFDNGTLSPVNLILWTQIIMNIDPKGEVQFKCDEKMGLYMDTAHFRIPQFTKVGQQIMDKLQQIVEQINSSPVLEQIYVEFSKQLGIPSGQQLKYAFKFCKLHFIYNPMVHGLTLLDGTIILSLFQIYCFVKKKHELNQKQMDTLTGYYLIVLLHESAHFFLRTSLNEYEINTWEKAKMDNPNSNYTDSGVMLELILIPLITSDNINGITTFNDLMAEFLLDISNWQLPLNEFQNKLQVLSQTNEETITIELKSIYTRGCVPYQRPRRRLID